MLLAYGFKQDRRTIRSSYGEEGRRQRDHLDSVLTVRWQPEQWAREVAGNGEFWRYLAGKTDWVFYLIGQGG